MAFLGPAVRWPDAIGIDAKAAMGSMQQHLPAPLSALSPELLLSILVSFTLIAVVTISTATLQLRSAHRSKEAAVLATHKRRRLPQEISTVLLAGPSGVGKTSLYSALAFHAVPSVHPSQRASDGVVALKGKQVRVIDTPGHPRIKDAAIGEYIGNVDAIVFCIDAKEALRGGANTSKDGPLIEAVDHLHSILIMLAKAQRAAKKTWMPPQLVLLFTRADLSPHLANTSLLSLEKEKSDEGNQRENILMQRARNAIELELGRRRAGMGFGARQTRKVGGMGHVIGGEQSTSVWASIKSILGLGSKSSSMAYAVDDDADEDDGGAIDYVDWDTLERIAAKAAQGDANALHASSTSLQRLDSDIIQDGRATFAFASVGKERGWTEREIAGICGFEQVLCQV